MKQTVTQFASCCTIFVASIVPSYIPPVFDNTFLKGLGPEGFEPPSAGLFLLADLSVHHRRINTSQRSIIGDLEPARMPDYPTVPHKWMLE